MSQAKVTMTVRSAGNRISIIDIHGEVTGAAENVLTDAYDKAGADARAVALNFTDLEYMNSSGIGLLVMLIIRAQRPGKNCWPSGFPSTTVKYSNSPV